MKDQNEIELILADVLAKSKDLYIINQKTKQPEWKGVPDYYEGYQAAVKQVNRIANHSEVDKYPAELFKHRAPNQNAEESEYIENNYKNTTHPVFMDYLSVTSRGLNDHNWSIEFSDTSAEEQDYKHYITTQIDVFKSVERYVKDLVPTLRANDANGVMTFDLKQPKTVVKDDGEEVVDDRERLEPQPKFYSSAQVVEWTWNEHAMFESTERSVVQYYNQPMKIGRVFYFYDDTNIWKIEQTGNFIDNTFNLNIIFAHDLKYFPCQKMKGVPKILKSDEIYYTSRFYFSVDPLDWSLLYSNYLNAAIANVCFPFRWQIGDNCDFTDADNSTCHNGRIATKDGEMKLCPSCKGSGMKVRTSVMSTYLLKPKEGQDEGDTSFPTPVGFVSPETDTLDFTDQKAASLIAQAREMLHIHTSDSKVKGNENETALGKIIDMKAMFAFVQPDSDQTFDVFQFLLDVIGDVRYGKNIETAKLTYPKTFDFRTEADVLEDIRTAREANAPTHIVNTLIHQYIRTRFFAERDTARVSELITTSDRLLTLTSEEIVQRKAQNIVEAWEIVLHDSAFTLINELIFEEEDFLSLDIDKQVEKLVTKAKQKAPEDVIEKRARKTAERLVNGN